MYLEPSPADPARSLAVHLALRPKSESLDSPQRLVNPDPPTKQVGQLSLAKVGQFW